MKNEYIELLKKVEETDAYFTANLDIKDPMSLYGTNPQDPRRALPDEYRKALTVKLARVKSPKDPEESRTRKRALVQIQFLWLLADVFMSREAKAGEHPEFFSEPLLRYKCVYLSLRDGGPLSTSIDFETMAWIRTIDIAKLKEAIRDGSFKGKLCPDKDSPYYGMENSEAGAQIMTDFCVGELNPAVSAKLYSGTNAYRFVHERLYGLPTVKKMLTAYRAAEDYWFLHILDERAECAFRIRFVKAFRSTLHTIYVQDCMQDHRTDDITARLKYAVLHEHGITELVKAYKMMYDPSEERVDFLYQGENPAGREYMTVFMQVYKDIRKTLSSDREVMKLTRNMLAGAAEGKRPEYCMYLADSCMKTEAEAQLQILKACENDPEKMWKILEANRRKSSAGESFEAYRYRMAEDISAFMTARTRVRESLNEKLERSTEAVREKYAKAVEEILTQPERMLEIAYENHF